MNSIDFPGAYLKIGAGQEQYHTIHAIPIDGEEGQIVCIYELSDEEIKQIVLNRKIFYSRLTFHNQAKCIHCQKITPTGFQPMRISTTPIDISVKLSYSNGEVVAVEAYVGPEGVFIPGYSRTPEGKYIKDDVETEQ